MNLTSTFHDSFASQVAHEIGVSLQAARDLVTLPTSLRSTFIPVATAAFLGFGTTIAEARGQLNAYTNGSAEGLISGVYFGDGENAVPSIRKSEKDEARAMMTRVYISSIFDSIDLEEIKEDIIENVMRSLESGQKTIRHEDVDRCIHDYLHDHYGPEFEHDPLYHDFRDDVKSQLRERNIQIVIIDTAPFDIHPRSPLGESFSNSVMVAVIETAPENDFAADNYMPVTSPLGWERHIA
jgi:hypothetical protein